MPALKALNAGILGNSEFVDMLENVKNARKSLFGDHRVSNHAFKHTKDIRQTAGAVNSVYINLNK